MQRRRKEEGRDNLPTDLKDDKLRDGATGSNCRLVNTTFLNLDKN